MYPKNQKIKNLNITFVNLLYLIMGCLFSRLGIKVTKNKKIQWWNKKHKVKDDFSLN